jgi:pseudaminic acid biosynthesis-associated methylase
MRKYKTEQESFWAGDFGNNYILRNMMSDELTMSGRMAMFSKLLSRTRNVKSVIEYGANIGANAVVVKQLMPKVQMSAIEINKKAVAQLAKLRLEKIYNTSVLEFKPNRQWDLVVTSGLLIHINPHALPKLYATLYQSSRRYICVSEYYNPTPVALPYRGHEARLFKRDFAGDMLDKYADLKLVDYGFVYHRDPIFPLGDVTWFLLEKTKVK